MGSTDIYRKSISLLIFLALFGAILAILPWAEDWLRVALESNQMAWNMLTSALPIIKIFLWMAIVVAIVRFVAWLLMSAAARRSTQAEVSSLLKTVFSILVYIVAFFLLFQNFYPQVSLAPLFTGSTILGIVVGLALQETLGNLFAGIAMQADQPFQVGDVIAIANRGTGVVESVSWRGVKIRTFQNKLVVVSNAVLGKDSIEVAPRNNLNARAVFFSTPYSVSPSTTSHLIREAIRGVENISPKMRPVVRIRNLGDDGIDWEIKYWLENYARYNDTDALIRERIWYAFQREKIDFSSPTRAISVKRHERRPNLDEKISTRSELLAGVAILGPLSEEELKKLAAASRSRVYAAGEAIIRIGAEGNSMFIIVRGAVEVRLPGADGPKIVNTLGENDFFGEMSLLTGEPRSATVVSSTETEVLQIGKKALKPILEDNPNLVQSICAIISERREGLSATAETEDASAEEKRAGVLRSIRKFFGLGRPREI